VKAVFSARFKADLNREEAKYAEVSTKLASAFRERIAGQTREVIKWKEEIMWVHTDLHVVGPNPFPITSITQSTAISSTFSPLCMSGGIQISSKASKGGRGQNGTAAVFKQT
jgi:hypothetical protein